MKLTLLSSAIRRVMPSSLTAAVDSYRRRRRAQSNQRKSTEEVFTAIYATNRWGGQPGTYFSGLGSRDDAIVTPYLATVTEELRRIGAASLTALDLGCGDFTIGRQIAQECGRYIGVDIVKSMIEHHQAIFGSSKVKFLHANIVEDPLPHADICFVRQVLQHLSNAQISAFLPKLTAYRWCFITEHHPSTARSARPNLDKPHGDDIRVSLGSGVFLDAAPFDIAPHRLHLLLEVPGSPTSDGSDPGIIRTYLLDGRAETAV